MQVNVSVCKDVLKGADVTAFKVCVCACFPSSDLYVSHGPLLKVEFVEFLADEVPDDYEP